MPDSGPSFSVFLAESERDLLEAQSLRYEVFVRELGATGEGVDHQARIEKDRFDQFSDHLLLRDDTKGMVVGVYRLLREDQAERAGCFYTESEFDLSKLKVGGRRLLELGRSCLHRDYRGGIAMFHLWNALTDYVTSHGIEVLFGTASFHGTDAEKLAEPLSMLYHNHLAPEALRVHALSDHYQTMSLRCPEDIDRKSAMKQVPALIKAYLRLGGTVGDGAYVDHAFNTTDVCLILDTRAINARQQRMYSGLRQT